jgi:hypothetical protein
MSVFREDITEVIFQINPKATEICICHNTNRIISVNSGEIWPIPVRGSKYKIQFSEYELDYSGSGGQPIVSKDRKGDQRRIGMSRLKEFSPGPIIHPDTVSLIENIRKWKNGPITITPKGETIVWRRDEDGWNPYYAGIVNVDPIWFQHPARLGHPGVNGLFPTPESSNLSWFTPKEWGLWTGCMFKTGEPWTVRKRSRETPCLTWPGNIRKNMEKGLIIRGTDTIHPELIKAYFDIRPCGGRLYVLMGGHIWMNAKKRDIADDEIWEKISNNTRKILKEITSVPNHPLFQMFNARMMATKGDDGVQEGCMPIYLGNCADFDGGEMPVTRITPSYKRTVGNRDPNRIEGDEVNPYAKREEMEE